jgi:hypothetical protein
MDYKMTVMDDDDDKDLVKIYTPEDVQMGSYTTQESFEE